MGLQTALPLYSSFKANGKPRRPHMLLTIQPDESLRSFLERHIYLDSKSPSAMRLREISSFDISASSITVIAEALGKDDLYGFHRILHDHTSYPQMGIFRHTLDVSYSNGYYRRGTTIFETELQPSGFCILCIREDVATLGYSYWRRDHRYVDVCSKHNVILSTECPICEKNISTHGVGFGHDLLWNGCSGRHVEEFEPTKNLSAVDFAYTSIYAEIGASKVSLDVYEVTKLLTDKIATCTTAALLMMRNCKAELSELDGFARGLSNWPEEYRPGVFDLGMLIPVISYAYGSFSALVEDLHKTGGSIKSINDLMRVEHEY